MIQQVVEMLQMFIEAEQKINKVKKQVTFRFCLKVTWNQLDRLSGLNVLFIECISTHNRIASVNIIILNLLKKINKKLKNFNILLKNMVI